MDAASTGGSGTSFKEPWVGKKLKHLYLPAFSLAGSTLRHPNRRTDASRWLDGTISFVRSRVIPRTGTTGRQAVTSVGDGWLEAAGQRYEGWVYLAAGILVFAPVRSRIDGVRQGGHRLSFLPGERPGRIESIAPLASSPSPSSAIRVRPTSAMERPVCDYLEEHERATFARAAYFMGLTDPPIIMRLSRLSSVHIGWAAVPETGHAYMAGVPAVVRWEH